MDITYIREQQRYTQSHLIELLNVSLVEIVPIIRRLKEFGILKAVKATSEQLNMSDLLNDDIDIADVVADDHEHFYVFTYVGVISIAGRVLICYPKYLPAEIKPKDEMCLIIKVLEKYNSKEQIIRMFDDSSEGKTFNLLAILLFLLQDYHEYGPYNSTEEIVEVNGSGEILWDKTINEAFTIVSKNRPYYPELYTTKRVTDDYDFFRRLHECIVTKASNELESSHLLDIFELTGIDVSDEELSSFGDAEYVLYRIENELATQYNTRKQLVLKVLFSYIAHDSHLFDIDCFSMYGTNSFNLVWEKICQEILDNKLHTRLKDLNISLNSKYTAEKYKYGSAELIEIIDKPYWSITEQTAHDTLIPDLITIAENSFVIFDAKYYNPILEPGKAPKGQPGIESITKQYLYQMAYQEFIEDNGFDSIINCFIIPTANPKEDVVKGHVEMGFLRRSTFALENIQVRLIPVKDAYLKYLNGEKYPISALRLNTSIPSVRVVS